MLWIALAIVTIIFLSRSKYAKAINRKMAKCPACESELTKYAWAWYWLTLDWVLWFCFLAATGLINLHGATVWLIAIPLSIAWVTARDRLYHHYWMWRHPLRCEKGGHAEPQVNRAAP